MFEVQEATMFANATVTQRTPISEQVEVILTGFHSFADINLVRKALARIAGVAAIQPIGRIPGAMAFTVTYDGMVPFEVHLAELLRGRELPDYMELSAA
ncbi:MAG: hypothetical protein H6675_03095 [Dehalococcoidia bacterium]|nr:hypothetical protein [Dehalococcoidia bacterium]MCB9482975.1 hypothetical protein [Dehalococcoidia bacterium]